MFAAFFTLTKWAEAEMAKDHPQGISYNNRTNNTQKKFLTLLLTVSVERNFMPHKQLK
jgi:hypothetical protein